MNKNLAGRLFLDLVMTILMVIMMGYDVSGALWHEILGIATVVLFLIHIIINARWMKQVIVKHTAANSPVVLIKFIIDLIQIVLMIIIAVSSVLISGYIFHAGTNHYDVWAYLHTASGYLLLITIGVHIGFHSKMIFSAIKKLLGMEPVSKARTIVMRILAVIMVIMGIKSSFDRGIAESFIPYFAKTTQESTQTSQVTNEIIVDDYDDSESITLATLDTTVTASTADSSSSSTERVSVETLRAGGRDHGDVEQSFDNNPPTEDQDVDDYLGSLTCTGCGKRCSLLRPQCNTGVGQAEDATAYFEEYTAASSTESDSTQEDLTSAADSEQGGSSASSAAADTDLDYVVVKDSAVSLFADYIPILSMYAIGGHYVLIGIEAARRRKNRI